MTTASYRPVDCTLARLGGAYTEAVADLFSELCNCIVLLRTYRREHGYHEGTRLFGVEHPHCQPCDTAELLALVNHDENAHNCLDATEWLRQGHLALTYPALLRDGVLT